MKYFLIAGEASGDLHASNLIRSLKASDTEAGFLFIGGDKMADAGSKIPLQYYKGMNYMGLWAVLRNIFKLSGILKHTKKSLLEYQADVLILVDYAGFNLRMAKFAYKNDIPVFYYISPKVWAWRKSRIKLLKKYITKLFVIFPFEIDFFMENNLLVEYHGNPLTDAIEEFKTGKSDRSSILKQNELEDRPIVALLAGSRRQEILSCLPEMIEASTNFPDYQFVVAGAPSVEKSVYDRLLNDTQVRIVYNHTYQLLSVSEAAVVTSGTATLEAALLNVPQVVVYKTGNLTYRIGKLFVTFRFFSLVNLIYKDELVKEILQKDVANGIKNELKEILYNDEYRSKMKQGYDKIREGIGSPGVSGRIAKKMIELLR